MKNRLFLVVLIILPIFLVGCNGKKIFAPSPSPTPSQIQILNHHMEEEWLDFSQEWKTQIIGEAKNNSGQACTPIIIAKFFNYSDVMIEESVDWLTDMGSGEVWRFEIFHWGERIKRYEVWIQRIY